MDATLPNYTPSFVPTTQFGQMAQQKRDTLSTIADIAQKAADVVNVIKAPSGTRIDSLAPPPSSNTPFSSITNFQFNSLIKNPLFVGAAALALVYFLKK